MRKRIKENNDNKTNKKTTLKTIIVIVLLLIVIRITAVPVITLPSIFCNDGETIATIEGRKVESYCINVIHIKSLNKGLTTEDLLKGTVETEFIWDGGTTVNVGLGYTIIDCSDNMREPRRSPIVITKKRHKDEALSYCEDYIREEYGNN